MNILHFKKNLKLCIYFSNVKESVRLLGRGIHEINKRKGYEGVTFAFNLSKVGVLKIYFKQKYCNYIINQIHSITLLTLQEA